MYISSSSGTRPCTNTAVILHCTEYSFNLVASTIITQIVLQWTTSAHVSKKSIPSFWQSPRAQNLALNFFTEPSGYLLILKAHVLGSTFISGVRHTISQQSKPLVVRVFSSVLMACQNSAWKGPLVTFSRSIPRWVFFIIFGFWSLCSE